MSLLRQCFCITSYAAALFTNTNFTCVGKKKRLNAVLSVNSVLVIVSAVAFGSITC